MIAGAACLLQQWSNLQQTYNYSISTDKQ